jgi:phosphoribosylglycinamide formyltransferase-1
LPAFIAFVCTTMPSATAAALSAKPGTAPTSQEGNVSTPWNTANVVHTPPPTASAIAHRLGRSRGQRWITRGPAGPNGVGGLPGCCRPGSVTAPPSSGRSARRALIGRVIVPPISLLTDGPSAKQGDGIAAFCRDPSSLEVRTSRKEAAVVALSTPSVPSGASVTFAPPPRPARLVVLVSGAGTNLQALLDASATPDFGAQVVAVGADRPNTMAIKRAANLGLPTFELRVRDFPRRADWDRALRDAVAEHRPDLVVLAGFMKLVGADFLATFGGRVINTHPALSPAFPGMHGPRDALAYGVKVTGCTVFVVADGVDDGPVVAQVAVPVLDGDDEHTLHERIKTAERALLVDTVGRMARGGWTINGRKVLIPC